MSGSVFLRKSDGRWLAQVSIGGRGERRYVSRSAATEAEAQAILETIAPPALTRSERFWSHVDKTGECWLWTGSRNHHGYGLFGDGRTVTAHRFAWTDVVGPIPPGKGVLHRCDNPPCVRPDHLFLGTQADNVADMVAKGRHRQPPGNQSPRKSRPRDSEGSTNAEE